MRNVLIVAPHFPPSGLPPSHRARQFATHLPRYGWQPTVLTVRPEFLQEQLEPELCPLVPDDVEVVRTAAMRPRRPGEFLGFGDLGVRVLFHQARVISRLCRERHIDLVYLLCPPNHQLLLGRLAHSRTGVPYVFDYIDPWISDWLEQYARPWTKLWAVHQLARWLEPLAIHRAAGITSVSAGTTDGVLRRYPALTREMGLSLPYGAEPELFSYVRDALAPRQTSSDVRELLYLGAMWEAAHDTLRAFFGALRLLKERDGGLYSRLKVRFVGTSYAPDASSDYKVAGMAADAGVGDVVTETPRRLPFLDALRTLSTCDTLLMLGSSEPHYTPSRLLPYVFARRPIFALMHAASDATDHLRRHAGVTLATYDTEQRPEARVPEIHAALVEWLNEGRQPDLAPLDDRWDSYTARALTGQLASFFDRLVAHPKASRSAAVVHGLAERG